MRQPSDHDLNVAIAWLSCNDGDDGEMQSCQVVVKWLDQKRMDAGLRRAAKEYKVPMKAVRKKLKGLIT
jgi:hypothetical protein